MRTKQPGFQTDQRVVVDFWLPQPRYSAREERVRFFDAVLDRVRTIPGVRTAALVADLPLGGGSDGLGFHIPGRPDPAPGRLFQAGFNLASDGYFQAMGIPVRTGREFAPDDRAAGTAVAVVNETAERRFWPGESAIGRQIELPAANGSSQVVTVVGVVGDVLHESLLSPARPEFFLNVTQANLPWPYLVLVVWADDGDPLALAPAIKSAARGADPVVPIQRIRTVDEVVSASMSAPRTYTLLLGGFAVLALLLAAVGLYGVVAYTVSQRTHEIGVRIALGAASLQIMRLVVAEGLLLAGIGTAAGLLVAVGAIRALEAMMHGVETGDPATFAAVALTLFAVTIAATCVPARRAARVDPIATLKAE